MFTKLLPDEISHIFSFLSSKDLKNISLCSKQCNVFVAPWLWEYVGGRSSLDDVNVIDRLLDMPIPLHVAHCRRLTLNLGLKLGRTNKMEEIIKMFLSLIELSAPEILVAYLKYGACKPILEILEECLSAVSTMGGVTSVHLICSNKKDLPVLDESCKLKVLHLLNDINVDFLRSISRKFPDLHRYTSLEELEIVQMKLSADDVKGITSLPCLKILRLKGVFDGYVGDHDLHNLKSLKQLNYFQLVELAQPFRGFEFLQSLQPGLMELNLCRNKAFDDMCMLNLKTCSRLRKVNLADTGITGTGWREISNLTHLKELNLDSCRITDHGLEEMKHLTSLQVLILTSCLHITDACLEHLSLLMSLDVLDLSYTQVTGSTLYHLKHLPITVLNLVGCKIAEVHLKQLKGCCRLKEVFVDERLCHDRAQKRVTLRRGGRLITGLRVKI